MIISSKGKQEYDMYCCFYIGMQVDKHGHNVYVLSYVSFRYVWNNVTHRFFEHAFTLLGPRIAFSTMLLTWNLRAYSNDISNKHKYIY